MQLKRTIEQWQHCDPGSMANMSYGAIYYAFVDAKHDILTLHHEIGCLRTQYEEAMSHQVKQLIKIIEAAKEIDRLAEIAELNAGTVVDFSTAIDRLRSALRKLNYR